MTLPPATKVRAVISDGGPRDGAELVIEARMLTYGVVIPEATHPVLLDPASGAVLADDPSTLTVLTFSHVRYEWDGTRTVDGAYRFRRT